MFTVKITPEFAAWLDGLKDRMTRLRLSRRLDKVQRGNLGDVRYVGDGLYEMREFFGPGWRMYYTIRDENIIIIIMLGGGDKSSQSSDIAKAKQLLTRLED